MIMFLLIIMPLRWVSKDDYFFVLHLWMRKLLARAIKWFSQGGEEEN